MQNALTIFNEKESDLKLLKPGKISAVNNNNQSQKVPVWINQIKYRHGLQNQGAKSASMI